MMGFEKKMNALLPNSQKPSDRPAKRVRLQNFTERENEVLVSLASKEAAIIESKKSCQASNTRKSEVWHAITEAFNSHRISEPRDMASLRNRYENLKRRLRKKIIDQKGVLASGERAQMVAANYEAKLWEIMACKPDGVGILENDVMEVVGNGSDYRKVQFISADQLDEGHAETLDISYERPGIRLRVAPVSPMKIKEDSSQDSFREASDDEAHSIRPARSSTTGDTTTTFSTNNIVVNPSQVRQHLSSGRRLMEEGPSRPYRLIRLEPVDGNSRSNDGNGECNDGNCESNDGNCESSDGTRHPEEEHHLKMKIMKEEHEAKMKLLTQELKMKEEEHALRMKILKRKLFVICEDL